MLEVQDRTARMQKRLNKKKANLYFAVILGVFVISLSIVILRNLLPGWDESVYISMGKYLYSMGKVGGWEIMRPIALPVLLGALWKTGLNPVYSAKALTLVLSSLSLFLVYLTGRELFGNVAALAASLFYAVTPVFFYHSTFALTAIPSTVFALLAIYLLAKRYSLFLAGIFAALAFLFRFPQGLFLVAILLTIAISSFRKPRLMLKKMIVCSLGFLAALIPFFLFNYISYSADVSFMGAILRPMLEASSQQANPFYPGSLLFYLLGLFKSNPLLLFSIAGVVWVFRKKEYNGAKLLALTSLLLFLVYFSFIISKQLRFALVFLPYLSLFAGLGFSWAFEHRKIRKIIMVLGILLLVIAVPVASYLAYNTIKQPPDYPIEKFYSYFNTNPVEGVVMTTVPQPMAYSDVKFKPLYYVPWTHFSELEENISAVMLVPSIFLCLEEDLDCIKRRETFFNDVRENSMAFSEKYNNKSHEIYIISKGGT